TVGTRVVRARDLRTALGTAAGLAGRSAAGLIPPTATTPLPDGSSRRSAGAWLIGGLLLAAAPHLPRLPVWVAACFLASVAWRGLGELRGWPLPGPGRRGLNMVKQVIAVAVFAGVYVSFGGGLGREAGVALLVVLLGLKVLEIKDARDHYVAA